MKRTRARIALVAIILGAPTLAACGAPEPLIVTPPPALLTCEPAPEVPATLPAQGTAERDQASVKLWLDERAAGADCRTKIDGVRAWVAEVSD